MKKIIMIALIVFFSMIINGATAFANWSFQLDNIDNIDGTSTETYEIRFITDETLILDNYQLNFRYDATEMEYESYTNTPTTGLYPNFFGDMVEEAPGKLWNFAAATFGSGPEVSSDILIGTITFDVFDAPPSVKDGAKDLWFAADDRGFAATINGVFYNFNLDEVEAAHLTYGPDMDAVGPSAVPIPGAIWFLGSGLLGLIGIRRKRA